MSVYAIFGQNGAGKDVVLTRISKLDPRILIIKSTKVFMRAIGYSVDPLSPEEPPREYYLRLERIPLKQIENIADVYFRQYLERFIKKDVKAIATLHLALLKKDYKGKVSIYTERVRSWYAEIIKGAIYLKADQNSIWLRRQKDLLMNQIDASKGKDRGDFSKTEILLQNKATNQAWDVLVRKCFRNCIPYLVLDNSNSHLGESKKIDMVARKIVEFIDKINHC